MSFDEDLDEPRAGGGGFDLRYWLWVFRRRFWLFAVVAAALSAAGVGVALVLPPTYEARATLLMESQQIPTDLVRSTVSASAAEQIELVKQRLLTREVLLDLAERHKVFPADSPLSPTERVAEMRSGISFQQRALGGGRRGDTVSTAFTVSFRSGSGAEAAGVVNDLVTSVLSRSAEMRRSRASTTTGYFQQEVARLSRELAKAEADIVAFQKTYESAMPDSLAYRRSQLDLLQQRMQRFELERIDLEQETASLRLALGEDADGKKTGTAVEEPLPVTDSQRQLTELRRELIRRRAVLSDDHPEIRSLRNAIAAQERVVADETAAIRSGELPNPNAGRDAALIAQAASAQENAVRELRRRLSLADARLEFNQEATSDLRGQLDQLERTLLETPNIQMELKGLERRYEALEVRYRAAVSKLAEAEAGEQLEDKQQGERFEVIEQATVPDEPVAPNRKLYALLGVGGGCGAGLGLVLLLEMMTAVVRRPEDLARIGREPAAVIPYIVTPGEYRRLWGGRIAALVLLIGGAVAALWAVDAYYLPLETVAGMVAEKLKLDEAADLIRRRFGS